MLFFSVKHENRNFLCLHAAFSIQRQKDDKKTIKVVHMTLSLCVIYSSEVIHNAIWNWKWGKYHAFTGYIYNNKLLQLLRDMQAKIWHFFYIND